MNKTKIIIFCLLVLFITLVFFKIKNKQEYHQKAVLAMELRKALEHLMIDLRQVRENTIQDVPADGQWHSRFAFENAEQGLLEYMIKDGHLLRVNGGKTLLIADNIGDLRIRRQKETPDILEVQIEAQKNVALVSNLKIRVRE